MCNNSFIIIKDKNGETWMSSCQFKEFKDWKNKEIYICSDWHEDIVDLILNKGLYDDETKINSCKLLHWIGNKEKIWYTDLKEKYSKTTEWLKNKEDSMNIYYLETFFDLVACKAKYRQTLEKIEAIRKADKWF